MLIVKRKGLFGTRWILVRWWGAPQASALAALTKVVDENRPVQAAELLSCRRRSPQYCCTFTMFSRFTAQAFAPEIGHTTGTPVLQQPPAGFGQPHAFDCHR